MVKARFLAAEIQRLFALGQLRKVLACALILCRAEAQNHDKMQGTQRGIVKGEFKRKAVLTVAQGEDAAKREVGLRGRVRDVSAGGKSFCCFFGR